MQNVIQDSTLLLSNKFAKELSYTLWGVFLLFLSAQISIPLEPVPITLQTFGVMLVALSFPRKTALQAVITYLVLGGMGLPFFAGFTGGLAKFIGPTAGYLFGFLAAVAVMGALRQYFNRENFFHIALNCLIGTLVIFAFGIGWLAYFMGIHKAVQVGLMPFILPGAVKILLLAATIRYLKLGKRI